MLATPLHVLYVEDEPNDVTLLEHELRRSGFAPSGQRVESREAFLAHLDPKLDVILTDFTMPNFNGLEALRLMKESKLDVPFIFVSGTIGEDNAVAAMQEGAADYLIKDRLMRLGSAIKQALERRRLRAEKVIADQAAARLAAIVETSGDAIIAMTLEGNVTNWNRAAEKLYGYSLTEILGQNISIVFPQGRRQSDAPEDPQNMMSRVAQGEHFGAFETVRVRKDGRRVEVLASISPLRDPGGVVTGASCIAHDITQIKRNIRFLDAQQAVAVILSESRDLEEAGPKVLQTIAECLRWEVAVLWTIDREANVLRRMHSWHARWADANFIDALSRKTTLRPGVGVAGRTWSMSVPVWEPGITIDSPSMESSTMTREGLRCGFGFPMRQGAEMMGVIEFYNPELREPDSSLIAALDNVASQVSQFCERRASEAALRASEARFRQLADAMPQIVWTARPDGEIDYFNERCYQLAECSRAEDPEQTWRSIVHPDDLRRSQDGWAESVRCGASYEIEIRIIERGTGRHRWYLFRAVAGTDAAGIITHWYGTGTDIDDQRRSLEALGVSEERFRNLVMALPAAVYTTDQTGRITLFNEHAVELWGRRPNLEKDRWGCAHKLFRQDGTPLPLDESPIAVAVREGRSVRGQEVVIERPDGSRSHVLPHPEPLRGVGGEIVGAVNMVIDLTHTKKLEEQFRQAQKMEAIGRLAGGVAHDFNNLLTIILGYGEIMQRGFHQDDFNYGLIEEIIRAGQRATSLTRQLLLFSRQQVLRPQVLNLNAVLTDSEKMLRRLIGEDVELRSILDPALGNVKADSGQLEQVLLNLVVNARDAMPRGGKLTLSTQQVELSAEQLRGHAEIAPGPYVLLTVSDNGSGMDRATQSRIFEPFFTTKGTNGTGLGLATVFGIVKQSQGKIDVITEPGQGTTFNIYLPRVADPISTVECPPRQVAAGGARGKATILLAEDEDGVRTLTRQILQENGFTVLEAANGTDAIRIFEKQGDSIDLLITDVVMPRMSGRELADQLLGKRPQIKVLYMSGYTNDAVVLHGVFHDQSHFLQKPFNREGLAQKVREVLNAS
jgi:PAS domain S-box-containing protein